MKNLFFGLFGWRNGGISKWKRLIKSIQGRVKVLNNKRETVIRHSTNDVVQLLMNSEHQRALVRVDLLSKDQNIVAAYNLLDQFCDLISSNLPYILQHRDYPNDIKEALSSLLYASARCGDLPELMELRKLFGRRYGENFVRVAVELLPGNLVNPQMIEKLSVKSISHDVKFRLMRQIAIDNGLELEPLDIDCKLELQQDKVYDLSLSLNSNQINNAAKVEEPKELDHQYAPEIILHRFSSHSYPGLSSSSRASSSVSIDQQKVESITKPASENSFQLSERNIVYHNDVEEFKVQPGVQENSSKDKDQRVLLMFKSTSTQPQGDNRSASLSDLNECDHLYTDDHRMKTCEKSVGKTSSQNTAKKRKSTRRRLNRRCNQIEHQMCSGSTSMSFNIKDMESDMYYKKELNRRPVSSKTIHRRKLTSTEQLYCEQRKQKEERYSEDSLPQGSKSNLNCDVEDNCCLESPCYFVTSEDRNDSDCPTPRSSVSQPHTPKISREIYKKEIESCASSNGSHSKKMSPLTTQRPHPTYLRTSMTMPPREKPKDVVLSDQILRSASCEFPHSNGNSSSPCRHIHPKLPDCDELATMFQAFKEEYIESVIEEFSKEEYVQSVIEDFSKEFVCNWS